MEAIASLVVVAVGIVVFLCVVFLTIEGIVLAFSRCWWLALLALLIAPGLLFIWAIIEFLIKEQALVENAPVPGYKEEQK